MALKQKEVAAQATHIAAQRKTEELNRRAFLSGAWNPSQAVAATISAGPVVVGPACLALNGVVCRVCAEHCERHAIRFRLAPGGVAVPLVRAERCDGCGACVKVCPASAIALQAAALVNEEVA